MRSRSATAGLGVTSALALTMVARPAVAGPADGYALSNDAALRGGAAVVTGEDPASVWYNPAAAAAIRRPRIDASLSGYSLRLTRAPAGMVAVVGDRRYAARGRGNGLAVVPTAFSFATYLRRYRVSLVISVHNPIYADAETRMRITGEGANESYRFSQDLDALQLRRRYHAGPTIGWRVNERFSIGFQTSGLYEQNAENLRFAIRTEGDASAAGVLILDNQISTVRVIATDFGLGIRGQLSPWLRAGAAIRSPAFVLWRRASGGETIAVANTDELGVVDATSSSSPLNRADVPRWLTPWTFSAGLAASLPRGSVEVSATASTAQTRGQPQWQRDAVWNVQFGGDYAVRHWISLGGGVFTDRTDVRRTELYPSVHIHRIGASLGARIRNRIHLDRRERARDLVFETTVALRYALGFGRTGVLTARYPNVAATPVEVDLGDTGPAQQHLIGVYVGSGLQF